MDGLTITTDLVCLFMLHCRLAAARFGVLYRYTSRVGTEHLLSLHLNLRSAQAAQGSLC